MLAPTRSSLTSGQRSTNRSKLKLQVLKREGKILKKKIVQTSHAFSILDFSAHKKPTIRQFRRTFKIASTPLSARWAASATSPLRNSSCCQNAQRLSIIITCRTLSCTPSRTSRMSSNSTRWRWTRERPTKRSIHLPCRIFMFCRTQSAMIPTTMACQLFRRVQHSCRAWSRVRSTKDTWQRLLGLNWYAFSLYN